MNDPGLKSLVTVIEAPLVVGGVEPPHPPAATAAAAARPVHVTLTSTA